MGGSCIGMDDALFRLLHLCSAETAHCSRLVTHCQTAWIFEHPDTGNQPNAKKGRVMDWTPIIVALMAAAPGIFAIIQQRRKENANTASVQVGVSLTLVQEMQDQLRELKEEHAAARLKIEQLENRTSTQAAQIAALQNEVNEWSEGASKLLKQIEDAEMIPVWRPKGKKL